MKKMIFALAIGLTAMGCSRLEKGETTIDPNLIGTWEFQGDSISGNWYPASINHIFTYTFNTNNTFSIGGGALYDGCREGFYSVKINDSLLSLKYTCRNTTGIVTYKIKIENKTLHLVPKDFYEKDYTKKFQKISNK